MSRGVELHAPSPQLAATRLRFHESPPLDRGSRPRKICGYSPHLRLALKQDNLIPLNQWGGWVVKPKILDDYESGLCEDYLAAWDAHQEAPAEATVRASGEDETG